MNKNKKGLKFRCWDCNVDQKEAGYCYFLDRPVNPVKNSCEGCPDDWVINEGYYA